MCSKLLISTKPLKIHLLCWHFVASSFHTEIIDVEFNDSHQTDLSLISVFDHACHADSYMNLKLLPHPSHQDAKPKYRHTHPHFPLTLLCSNLSFSFLNSQMPHGPSHYIISMIMGATSLPSTLPDG